MQRSQGLLKRSKRAGCMLDRLTDGKGRLVTAVRAQLAHDPGLADAGFAGD